MYCREWPAGKADSEIQQLIKENSKPQDFIVYTDASDGSVTKDQSGWGFTVKQGVTTIHEDSAAYEVSTSSLTMETEAVTHALRWIASRGDSQTTHAIILTDSMSLLQKMKSLNLMGRLAYWSVFDIHLQTSKNPVGVLSWTCWSQRK